MLAQSVKKRLAVAAILVALGSGTRANAAPLSIRTLAAGETRLASVGYRISTANSHTCSAPTMMSGLVAHDLTQYPATGRLAVSRAFSLNEGIGVVGIVKGSGADRAGLRIDDEILVVGGRSVEDPAAWTQKTPSYDRMDRFTATLSASAQGGTTELLVRRQGQLLRLMLTTRPGCGGSVKYVDSSNINAWSDGRHVVLNAGIVSLAQSDDELAFVIAHEMAHNILGHIDPSANAPRRLFGRVFGESVPRSTESQADSAAVHLMRRGGYAPQGGLDFLTTARRKMWWALSLGHPGFASRLRTVASAMTSQPPANLAPAQSVAVREAATPGAPALAGPLRITSAAEPRQALLDAAEPCRQPDDWTRPCVVDSLTDDMRRRNVAQGAI